MKFNLKNSLNKKNIQIRERNLNLILDSNSYKLAQEDINLLKSNEMRGVRMLLEITKPDLILEEEKIISTIIVFGSAKIIENTSAEKMLAAVKKSLEKSSFKNIR